MTGFVGAVHVGVGGLSALVTMRDDIVGDPLAHAFVEDEILSDETVLQTLRPHLPCVVDDPAVQLIHVFETMMP